MDLNDDLHAKITKLCEQGDVLAKSRSFSTALERYESAWALLPHPREEWEAATWILAAIGDVYFLKNEYERALETFGKAARCPGGLGNPFIHLRLGESAYELGNLKRADDELTRAYMGGGRDIFKAEDPKYFTRLKGILKPPAGSTSL